MAQSRTRPSRSEAEAAVRTLIEWAGDDPDREGLLDTPGRVVRAYEELSSGYESDPREYLERTFEEVAGYDELVVLRDIRVVSFCEHHMLPFLGKAHVGYLPDGTMVIVESARKHIGETLDIVVTSALQTSAGRLVFAKLRG